MFCDQYTEARRGLWVNKTCFSRLGSTRSAFQCSLSIPSQLCYPSVHLANGCIDICPGRHILWVSRYPQYVCVYRYNIRAYITDAGLTWTQNVPVSSVFWAPDRWPGSTGWPRSLRSANSHWSNTWKRTRFITVCVVRSFTCKANDNCLRFVPVGLSAVVWGGLPLPLPEPTPRRSPTRQRAHGYAKTTGARP